MVKTNRRARPRRVGRDSITLGEVNRKIDDFFHPFFRKGPLPVVADSLAHALVEMDPLKSAEKFFQHNFGPLFRETVKVVRKKARR